MTNLVWSGEESGQVQAAPLPFPSCSRVSQSLTSECGASSTITSGPLNISQESWPPNKRGILTAGCTVPSNWQVFRSSLPTKDWHRVSPDLCSLFITSSCHYAVPTPLPKHVPNHIGLSRWLSLDHPDRCICMRILTGNRWFYWRLWLSPRGRVSRLARVPNFPDTLPRHLHLKPVFVYFNAPCGLFFLVSLSFRRKKGHKPGWAAKSISHVVTLMNFTQTRENSIYFFHLKRLYLFCTLRFSSW